MKTLKTLVFFMAVCTISYSSQAQSLTDKASQRALVCAESMLNALHSSNWTGYMAMTYPGMVKYYGGIEGFREYMRRSGSENTGNQPAHDKMEIIQIDNQNNEWQCVIRRSRETNVDGQKAVIISYMVGQSTDEANTWKYVDVAFNSSENLVYIMPDVFASLSIPLRQVIYEKDINNFEMATVTK